MQQIYDPKKTWQIEPKEKPVSIIPEKTELKLENTKPKEDIIRSPILEETPLENFLKNIPYPDFRYFCPTCGSLDVCITFHKETQKLIIDCLDCKKEWVRGYFHEGRTTICLC